MPPQINALDVKVNKKQEKTIYLDINTIFFCASIKKIYADIEFLSQYVYFAVKKIMSLKNTVLRILKEKHRSLSWLAKGIGKTFDGLNLALKNESLKYKDIIVMANLLEIHPGVLFNDENHDLKGDNLLSEPKSGYLDFRTKSMYDDLMDTMRDQLNDKDKIIALLEARR